MNLTAECRSYYNCPTVYFIHACICALDCCLYYNLHSGARILVGLANGYKERYSTRQKLYTVECHLAIATLIHYRTYLRSQFVKHSQDCLEGAHKCALHMNHFQKTPQYQDLYYS